MNIHVIIYLFVFFCLYLLATICFYFFLNKLLLLTNLPHLRPFLPSALHILLDGTSLPFAHHGPHVVVLVQRTAQPQGLHPALHFGQELLEHRLLHQQPGAGRTNLRGANQNFLSFSFFFSFHFLFFSFSFLFIFFFFSFSFIFFSFHYIFFSFHFFRGAKENFLS